MEYDFGRELPQKFSLPRKFEDAAAGSLPFQIRGYDHLKWASALTGSAPMIHVTDIEYLPESTPHGPIHYYSHRLTCLSNQGPWRPIVTVTGSDNLYSRKPRGQFVRVSMDESVFTSQLSVS
jgi:hypothetical protein